MSLVRGFVARGFSGSETQVWASNLAEAYVTAGLSLGERVVLVRDAEESPVRHPPSLGTRALRWLLFRPRKEAC